MQPSACVRLIERGSLKLRRNHSQWVCGLDFVRRARSLWVLRINVGRHNKHFVVSDFR